MKNNIFSTIVCLVLAGFFIFNQGQAIPTYEEDSGCKIYFVDRQLHRLVPTAVTPEKTKEKTAEKIVAELISGRDRNESILRIIPYINGCISVEVKEDTAFVNLSGDLRNSINRNGETEKLFIYQIVNSLVSVDGIDYVRFTIDKKEEKDFLGFLDMREIFTANYNI